ncbi:D-mannonate oxidoreductase [hydrothermal vent metagenome]|uniref:D-mannonate oxidoreductase n=1 Tax=hydrothermal vent metagenome TaxID=652676 RepID=A0A3B0TJF6_9ZZZZ
MSDTAPRIVHLGLGNFTRAHQAWYTSHANAAAGETWRIVGVSLRRPDVRNALHPQGFAYTLEIEDEAGTDYERLEVIEDILVAAEAPGKVVAAIADAATAIVSLTVTEKGYSLKSSDWQLDLDDPGIVADLAGDPPRTTIGYLAAGLAARRNAGHGPVTVMSCDNLPGNGEVLRAAMLEFTRIKTPELAGWIEAEVAFPCAMVDRIVPATTDALRARVKAATGWHDAWPVATERFSQWVIEDRFSGPRPRWEDAGAEIVNDVQPYEVRKLRLLNGAHSTLAYAGLLAGMTYVHEAVADEGLGALGRAVMAEAAETLPDSVRGTADDYAATLMRRFNNPGLAHSLIQIAMDGSQKLPVRILPSLVERLAAGRASPALESAIAAWVAFVVRTAREGGTLNDPLNDELIAAGKAEAGRAAKSLLAMAGIFGNFATDFPDAAKRIVAQSMASLNC